MNFNIPSVYINQIGTAIADKFIQFSVSRHTCEKI